MTFLGGPRQYSPVEIKLLGWAIPCVYGEYIWRQMRARAVQAVALFQI